MSGVKRRIEGFRFFANLDRENVRIEYDLTNDCISIYELPI